MNSQFTDSFDLAIKYCKIYHPIALNVRHTNDGDNFLDLDEEDIERIQDILDESDEDDDLEILSDDANKFPLPMKPTRK